MDCTLYNLKGPINLDDIISCDKPNVRGNFNYWILNKDIEKFSIKKEKCTWDDNDKRPNEYRSLYYTH